MQRAALCVVLASGCSFNTNDPFDHAEVVSLEDAPPPIAGGTLLATADGRAVIADADRDRVLIVDLATRQVRAIELEAGAEPGRVVEGESGRAFVVLREAGAVIEVDLGTAGIVARHAVCPSPRGLARDSARDRLHVACADGALLTIGPTGAIERQLALDPDLRDVVVTEHGLLVSRFRSAELIAISAEGVVAVDPPPLPVARLVGVDADGGQSGLSQEYAPSVAVRLVATSNGAVVLHQRARTGEEVVFEGMPPPETYTYSNESVSNGAGDTWRDPCHNAVVHSAATWVDTWGRPMHVAPSVARGVVPIDLAISPGGRVAVAFAGEPGGSYAYGPQVVSSTAAIAVRDEPSGCLESDRGDRFPGQVVAVAFAGEMQLVQLREPARLVFGGEVIELGGRSVRDTGHDVFHLDTGGAIACASCHPGGGDDGHVWEFAATERVRTIPLEGMVGLAPYHRAGDVPSFSALMAQLRAQMAGPALDAPELDAVEHWLERLPMPPAGPAGDTDTLARGRALFEREDVGCAGCHSGELGTDGATHTIQGEPWQTPGLRGIALRAPYLHDGRAPDLRAALQATGDGSHGAIGHLTEAELRDLEAYVLSR